MTSVPRRLSAGWYRGQRLMRVVAFPERPGLRQAAMMGRGAAPGREVVQAEEAA